MEKILYAYLPCYNEAGNIGKLTGEWLEESEQLAAEGYRLEVVPIDDASTDETLKIIRALEKEYGAVRVIAHEKNQNLGGVVFTAIRDFMARAGEDDLMCLMDGDDTHKPRFVHSMVEKVKNAPSAQHCVIASRYQPGSAVTGLQESRKLYSGGAKLYYSMILRVPGVKDYTCGYRVYTRAAIAKGLEKYGDRLVENRSFACMMELLYKLYRSGCTFSEVPFILYYGDKNGDSKMNIWKTVHDSLFTAISLRRSAK